MENYLPKLLVAMVFCFAGIALGAGVGLCIGLSLPLFFDIDSVSYGYWSVILGATLGGLVGMILSASAQTTNICDPTQARIR